MTGGLCTYRRALSALNDGGGSVLVQLGVQRAPVAVAGERLQRAADAVAPEQQPVPPGELARLDDRAVRQRDPRAPGDVAAGLDDAPGAQRDADAGVGAQQAAAADRDGLLAAPGERPHDRCPTADVAVRSDDDAGTDPALDHGRPERPGVEVD